MPASKPETREDEEQNVKFNETIDLLLAAGYFRARIKGLSPFDKIVGGMVWCITTCDFDVDVDLLFQENSTIGQKIALTEKIVAVLPRMKCPHRIEPHQIQGLDFIHIYPVIQWLVKRAIETREELGDKIREYSLMQFHKTHSMPQDQERVEKLLKSSDAIKTVKDAYKPRRFLKKPESLIDADEETKVQSTLLEYGKRYDFSKLTKSSKENEMQKKAHKAGLLKGSETGEHDQDEEYLELQQKIQAMMEGMSGADMKESLSSHTVGSIVGLQSEEIAQMAEEYATRQALLREEAAASKPGQVDVKQSHMRHVGVLKKGINAEENKLEAAKTELDEALVKLNEVKHQYEETETKQNDIQNALNDLSELEQGQNKVILNKLRGLVAMNESIKKQEQEFRAHCKEEMVQLQENIENLKTDSSVDDDESGRMSAVVEQLEKDKGKLQKIRLMSAKKNREIASLQWKIDDIPSRAELSQYQQRFIELYNQVANTHKETKQFYTLYNTLDDTKLYLEKEVNLLNSINDSFEQASSFSADSKDQFLAQMETILAGVMRNKENVEKKKRNEKIRCDALNDQYLDLLEKQRQYFRIVKEFKEECRKSELLQARIGQ